MNAKKCDRCGEFYTKNKVRYLDHTIVGVCLIDSDDSCMSQSYRDLCDNCLQQLCEWTETEDGKR